MHIDDILMLHRRLTDTAYELQYRKAQDYTGDPNNALRAFFGAELLGVDPRLGVLVRLQDKISRLASLIRTKRESSPAVRDESIMDTVIDMVNYSVLFYAVHMQMQNKTQVAQQTVDYLVDCALKAYAVAPLARQVCAALLNAYQKTVRHQLCSVGEALDVIGRILRALCAEQRPAIQKAFVEEHVVYSEQQAAELYTELSAQFEKLPTSWPSKETIQTWLADLFAESSTRKENS